MSDKLWYKVARVIIKSGKLPIPIVETFYELLKILLTEEQAKFLLIFNKKPSLNMEEIRNLTDLDNDSISHMLNDLMINGIITETRSRNTNILVYRLKPPFPGIFEAQFMRGEKGEKQKKVAQVFDKLFDAWSNGIQMNYKNMVEQFKKAPPINRVVPIQQEVEMGTELVLPLEDVQKIIEKHEYIAVTNCYCRHEKILLNDPCKLDAPVHNCLLFGKNAQFSVKYGFAESISKAEAKRILKESEDYGLVHKAFHTHQNPEREEEAVCSCCKCCCGVFQLHYKGVAPIHTLSSYIARVDEEKCVGCGTCIEKCPMEAIELRNTLAELNVNRCIGCGVCSYHCPNDAIKLERTGSRRIFIPPPKLTVKIKNF